MKSNYSIDNYVNIIVSLYQLTKKNSIYMYVSLYVKVCACVSPQRERKICREIDTIESFCLKTVYIYIYLHKCIDNFKRNLHWLLHPLGWKSLYRDRKEDKAF